MSAQVKEVIEEGHFCSNPGCNKPATLRCPLCVKFKAPDTYYCEQECFKNDWKEHSPIHIPFRKALEFQPPPYRYTGPLRPAYVSPKRIVPEHIEKPDYALNGIPISEQKSRATNVAPVYNDEEIQGIRESCKIARQILDMAGHMVKPGVLPEDIDKAVHDMHVKLNCYPSPLNYNNFPKACCISVNEVICHGIPDFRPLEEGDIVNIDISTYYKGFHSDLNETYCVGKVDNESKRLIKASYDSMMAAIAAARPGIMFRDFGGYITDVVRKHGFTVVKSYCGHGIGRLFHCAPNIPHYEKNKANGVCKKGMIFTIEPMINAGLAGDELWLDDWTAVTRDGKRSAQFEHTILITDDGCEILTARNENSPKLWWEEVSEEEYNIIMTRPKKN